MKELLFSSYAQYMQASIVTSSSTVSEVYFSGTLGVLDSQSREYYASFLMNTLGGGT